jgi:hypothetical protein
VLSLWFINNKEKSGKIENLKYLSEKTGLDIPQIRNWIKNEKKIEKSQYLGLNQEKKCSCVICKCKNKLCFCCIGLLTSAFLSRKWEVFIFLD